MNIFVLDTHPTLAAQAQCDQHVVKMIVESAQILSTVCRHYGLTAPLKATHASHPCVRWVHGSTANYAWLLDHWQALIAEYQQRYGKIHRYVELIPGFLDTLPPLPDGELTSFVQAMPEHYRVPDDAVSAYRAYYLGEKLKFARWRHGPRPDWVPKT